MKLFSTFLLTGIFLLLTHTQAKACDLDPTAVIDILPDEVVFLVGDSIYMEAYNSSPNCGYISGYRWRVDGVTESTSGYFIPNLTLQSEEDSRSVKGHEYSPPGVNSIPHLLSELSDSI